MNHQLFGEENRWLQLSLSPVTDTLWLEEQPSGCLPSVPCFHARIISSELIFKWDFIQSHFSIIRSGFVSPVQTYINPQKASSQLAAAHVCMHACAGGEPPKEQEAGTQGQRVICLSTRDAEAREKHMYMWWEWSRVSCPDTCCRVEALSVACYGVSSASWISKMCWEF